jgi:predicted ArsR family transcriptional regulator
VGIMVFMKRFTNTTILEAMSYSKPMTASAIANKACCNKITIIRALPSLEEAELIKRVEIASGEKGTITGWLKL